MASPEGCKNISPGWSVLCDTRGGLINYRVRGYPGYAQDAYPGLKSEHASGVASPEGCKNISPEWSVLCDIDVVTPGTHKTRTRG